MLRICAGWEFQTRGLWYWKGLLTKVFWICAGWEFQTRGLWHWKGLLTKVFCANSGESQEFLIFRPKGMRVLIKVEQKWIYGGREPSIRQKVRVVSLYSTLNLTGSQRSSDRGGEESFFDFQKTSLAVLLGVFWRQSSSDGKPARTELQQSKWLQMLTHEHYVMVKSDHLLHILLVILVGTCSLYMYACYETA